MPRATEHGYFLLRIPFRIHSLTFSLQYWVPAAPSSLSDCVEEYGWNFEADCKDETTAACARKYQAPSMMASAIDVQFSGLLRLRRFRYTVIKNRRALGIRPQLENDYELTHGSNEPTASLDICSTARGQFIHNSVHRAFEYVVTKAPSDLSIHC